jgi:hypothetical protein
MNKKPKEAIETIKEETKNYYKWKNMIPRYIIIWFLFVLIILQFILPKQNKEINQDQLQTEKEIYVEQQSIIFLEDNINLDQVQEEFDLAVANIVYNKNNLKIVYKKSLSYLPELEEILINEEIPTDFKYLIFLNNLKNITWPINIEAKEKYAIRMDQYVDQSLDYEITKNASIEYIKDLYKDFWNWNLVLMSYFMWSDVLKQTMMLQGQKEFKNIYFPKEIMDKYFEMIAYKYIIENILDYIEIEYITKYPQIETSIVKVWETKDLVKRSKKAWYNFKSIKELNPWILGNSIPKWKREIIIKR